ncbi:MAG: UxaA family hydrolase [Nocardioidaceae bacterium]
MMHLRFHDIAVLPEPDDNVAIATRTLDPGTRVERDGDALELGHTVLEGHRFVVRPIPADGPLLSWGTPFARAQRYLAPGDYVCTPGSLGTLQARGVSGLPASATAANQPLDPYRLDESMLQPGRQVDAVQEQGTFLGYAREHGVAGTRNHVVVIGATSRSGAFVTELARRFGDQQHPDFDGVVPVAHTEGGEDHPPNNLQLLLTALSGFLVHPNVGAVLLVDEPDGAVTGERVRQYMRRHGYPDVAVPHAFLTRTGAFSDDLDRAAEIVASWLPQVAAQRRTEQPLADLRIALQCGGSDAFSGISANPLAGAVAREVIRHGGSAVLAETDELIGAEGYLLENVRDLEVARRFLRTVEAFKERVSWHGHSPEGNPSGGNVYRGLYNIVLKSVGAARKRDRRLRLDHVIDYGEPLPGNGFTFMDSPGNDLESVAGQVATGCTLVFFTTGNGSITNFPFVPTLKFVTTSARYRLLRDEMDVDAGRFLTGTPMDELTDEVFDQTVSTASGEPSAGERAGHSQVSIWRDWKQTHARPGIAASVDGRSIPLLADLPAEDRDAELDGLPLRVPVGSGGTGEAVEHPLPPATSTTWQALCADGRKGSEQLTLLLPTSLCSGQIALRLAGEAEQQGWHAGRASRVTALPHTEGCGVTGGSAEETFARIMVGYLAHPNVRSGLLLEHGCEKTHNDYFRSQLVEAGLDPARFGWASIQRDGGLQAVSERVREWFQHATGSLTELHTSPAGLADLTIGIEARGELPPSTAKSLAMLGSWLVAAGGTVMLSSRGALLSDDTFRQAAFGSGAAVGPTLAHGQRPRAPGWHVMRMPTTDWLETATGLGAGGTQLLLAHVTGGTLAGHHLVPVVQVSADAGTVESLAADLDGVVRGGSDEQAGQMLQTLLAVASRERRPRADQTGNVGFQVTRGLLGVSM